jgi:hypothetical protein
LRAGLTVGVLTGSFLAPVGTAVAAEEQLSAAPGITVADQHATWGIGPAAARAVDGRPNFKWFVTPGAVLTDHVALVNLQHTPLTLHLYSRDATNGSDGKLALQPEASRARDVGSWIALQIPGDGETVRVPARSTVIVPILVHVPKDAAPGDHTGGVISSLSSKVTTSSAHQIDPKLEQRVAVPVAVRVSGPVHPQLSVVGLHASDGVPMNPFGHGNVNVRYRVVNTGNVNLGGRQQVSVHGLLGSTERVKAPDLPVLLPGSSTTFQVVVPGVLSQVLMSAHVHITPLVPSGDVDPSLRPSDAGTQFWAVPWLLLVALAAVAALVYRRVRGGRRAPVGRRRAKGRRRAGVPTPATARGTTS